MATITITYSAISAPVANTAAEICATFVPTNAAADLAPFDGTYYDTNVYGFGEGMSAQKFFADSIAHPGLIAALKLAVASGEYEFDTTDEDLIMYLDELVSTKALESQGFAITVEKN